MVQPPLYLKSGTASSLCSGTALKVVQPLFILKVVVQPPLYVVVQPPLHLKSGTASSLCLKSGTASSLS